MGYGTPSCISVLSSPLPALVSHSPTMDERTAEPFGFQRDLIEHLPGVVKSHSSTNHHAGNLKLLHSCLALHGAWEQESPKGFFGTVTGQEV